MFEPWLNRAQQRRSSRNVIGSPERMLPVRDPRQSSNTRKRKKSKKDQRPIRKSKQTSHSTCSVTSLCRTVRVMSICGYTHSRAQDDPILQTLLEVGADGEASESLDPASELCLLLRVILG